MNAKISVILLLLLCLTTLNCRTTSQAKKRIPLPQPETSFSLLENINKIDNLLESVEGDISIKLNVQGTYQTVSGNIKAKKGHSIKLVVRHIFGIVFLEALLTPDSIKAVSPFQGTYFYGTMDAENIYKVTKTYAPFSAFASLAFGTIKLDPKRFNKILKNDTAISIFEKTEPNILSKVFINKRLKSVTEVLKVDSISGACQHIIFSEFQKETLGDSLEIYLPKKIFVESYWLFNDQRSNIELYFKNRAFNNPNYHTDLKVSPNLKQVNLNRILFENP